MESSLNPRRLLLSALGLLSAGAIGYLIARSGAPAPSSTQATAAAAGGTHALKIPDSYLTMVGITLEQVQRGSPGRQVQALASVMPLPQGQAVVGARAAGTVTHIARRLGDGVRAGDTLAVIDSPEAAALHAARRVAEARQALARNAAQREQQLFDQHVTARQDLERVQAELAAAEAEAARTAAVAGSAHVLADGHSLALVSPIAGRITAANLSLGAHVDPDAALFVVADPRGVQIEAAIPAADMARVRVGDAAVIVTAAGAQLPASVRSLTPTLDEQSRTATALLALLQPGAALTPGEVVQARITVQPVVGSDDALAVAEDAVQSLDGRDVVFVRSGGNFEVRQVRVGQRSGGRAVILGGLGAGETIASRNAFLLKAELNKGAGDDE